MPFWWGKHSCVPKRRDSNSRACSVETGTTAPVSRVQTAVKEPARQNLPFIGNNLERFCCKKATNNSAIRRKSLYFLARRCRVRHNLSTLSRERSRQRDILHRIGSVRGPTVSTLKEIFHMKRKLIALAVASALAAPVVASAQGTNVTIFGRAQAEYSLVDFSTQHSQGGLQDNSRSSRWGLHITEDLGNGLKANARLEFGLNTGSGSATTPREQWVGLSHSQFGDVKFGRVQSPFKDFAGGMTIDPFAYTTLQANGAGGTMSGGANGLGSGANGFVNSAIRLDTANFAGFSFA